LAIGGEGYCIVAASTRLSTGFSILTSDKSMVLEVNSKCMIASAGFDGDRSQLHKVLTFRSENYESFHKKPMSCPAMAQMLGNTLYYKRFFPYYTFNLCAGLDEHGRGCVYTYDAIGSHERVAVSCQGSGKDLIQPVLDNQLRAPSILEMPPKVAITSLTLEEASEIVKIAFSAASERDIYTGDAVEIFVMTPENGVTKEVLPLRRD
jgi:20S proteasome subunit beta 6